MNQQNYEYLDRYVKGLGFEGLSNQLREAMETGGEKFVLAAVKTINSEKVRYELNFDKSKEQDYYFFNRYTAIRHKHIKMFHGQVGAVNTEELEQRMSKHNWAQLRYGHEPQEGGVAAEVAGILQDLRQLTGTPNAERQRDRLEGKFFLGTSYEDSMAHPGKAKDWFLVQQNFPVYQKRTDQQQASQTITPFEAYHMP